MVIHLSSERGTRTKEAADGQRGLYQTPVIEEGEKWELVEVCLWLFYKPLGGGHLEKTSPPLGSSSAANDPSTHLPHTPIHLGKAPNLGISF